MKANTARMIGVVFQGILLALLLALALAQMISTLGGGVVFRYQGF